MGDVTGDGRAELIFGTTLGGFVEILDFPSLTLLASGFPYGALFTGGVNLAAGDVDGDGIDEIAVAPQNAGGPVRIYNIRAELVVEGTPFGGVQGVSLAMGDLNGDGRDDLAMGAGAGATPQVRTFSILDRTQLFDDLAFDAGFRGGVWVATPRAASTRFTNAASTTFTAGAAGTFAVTTQNGSETILSVGGTLPAGVTFTDHGNGTGTLSGTPAAGTGGSYALTFVATRQGRQVAQQPFALVVQEGAAITSASAATFAIGGGNVFTVTTTGHPAATTITATGALPAGVTFTNNGNGTATLTGAPTPGSEGVYPLALSTSNGIGAPAAQTLALTVVAGDTPLFSSADATTFTVGAVGSFSVLTSATPIATITVAGALPAGVTFTNHGNGTATLSGVPDAGTAGTYPLVFTADNGVATTPQTFTLTVDPVAGGAPSFTSGNAITFAVGTAANFTATTIGTPIVATLTSSGALPTGITFTNNGDGTGTLAGTAAAGTAGSYPLTFTADNGVGSATQLFTLTVTNVSASPTFTSGATTAFVIGTSQTFAITTVASPAVTGIAITGALPTGVTFTDHGDGTATLAGTPQAGTAGPYALTFTATNGGVPVNQAFTLSVQETAAITSANARAFILGIADSFTVTTAGLPVPTIAMTAGALPAGVSYTDNGDGTATIAGTPQAGTVGAYPLTLTATNGVEAPGTQTFTLNVTQNVPPTLDAIVDPAAILEDAAQQTITLTGISAGLGDTQPLGVTATSGDPAIVPDPTVTYTTPNATGTLQYTPVPNASGSVVITVQVSDGGLDNDLGTLGDNGVTTRTFTVAVTAVNDAPTLDTIPNPAPIAEDAPQQTLSLAGIGAGGGETQTLQVTATSGNTTLLPDPTVTYTSPAATGSLAYTPVANQQGTAVVTVTVTDGGDDDNLGTPGDNLTVTRTFTVEVTEANDPPTLDAIANPAAINEDAGQQTINLTGITAGGETQVLQVTATSDTPTLIPNPAVTYVSPNATGSLTYTPVTNAFGSAIVTVTVTDGGLDDNLGTPGDNGTVTRAFTVTVNGVNDAPTFTPGGNQSVNEDAGPQTVPAFLGTVSAGPNEASQTVSVAIDNVSNPALFAAGPAISAAGVLTYRAASQQFGTATITYTVSDNGGTANGGVDAVGPLAFTITVNPVNDAPTINALANPAAILEDAGQQTINLSGISAGAGESTQPLQVTAVSDNPTLIPNPAVTYTSPNATGSIAYTPVANASGTAVITVTVTDGGLDDNLGTTGDNQFFFRTFTVNVTAVNDAPTFTPGGNQTVGEDTPGVQTVNPFLTSLSAGPANESGQVLSVDITNVQTPSLFSVPPAINSAGVLTYTLATEQFGSSTVTYVVRDNGGTANGGSDAAASVTFTITVNAVNDPPTLTAIADPAAILEDAAQQTINLAGIGTGSAPESAQPLQVTAGSSNTALIPNPTVTYVSPNTTGSLAYTPVANAFGTAVITVTVTDGGLDNDLGTTGDNGTVVDTFTVSVTAVNDAPSFIQGGGQNVNEDAGAQTVNPWATAISAGPGESGQTVSFDITNNTNTGLFASGPLVSPAGVLTYTPAANQNGTATITIRIVDSGDTANGGSNASATQAFVITVNPVNDAPVVPNRNYTAQANMAILGLSGLLTGVTDADTGINGCTPSFSVTNVSATSPPGGNINNLNTTAGTFDFNPPPGATGNVTFTYTVTDSGCPGTATSAAATVTINVAGPAIWFVDDSAAAGGDGRLTSPFNTLAGAAAVDVAGQVIFLYEGTYSTGIALLANESLMGQGAIAASFDALMGISPPAGTVARPSIGSPRPSISVTSGTAVALATGNVIHGLNVANTNGAGITGSAVGTVALANFDVTVTGGSALSVTTSGTVTATGADNDLTSTNGTALNVDAVTIGGSGLTFKSISAGAGANNGITLKNTGTSGGLTVTGLDSADVGSDPDIGSGGTIANKTGAEGSVAAGIGIYLENTRNISLSGLQLNAFSNNAIRGASVTNFTLTDSRINGVIGDQTGGLDSPIAFGNIIPATEGVFGTVLIDQVEVTGAIEHQLEFYGHSGSRSITVSNSNIHDGGVDGIQVEMRDSSTGTITITGNTFTSNGSQAVQVSTLGTSVFTVNVTGNTATRGSQGNEGILVSNGNSSHLTTTISNNTVSGFGGASIFVGQGPGTATSASDIRATISGNMVTAPAGATNNAVIVFTSSLLGQVANGRFLIDNNTIILNSAFRGILVDCPDSERTPNSDITVTNNKVEVNDNVNGVGGIAVQVRRGTGRADVRDNDVDFDNGTPGGVVGVRVRQNQSAPDVGVTMSLARGSSSLATAVATVLANNNPLSTTEVLGTVTVIDNGIVLLPSQP